MIDAPVYCVLNKTWKVKNWLEPESRGYEVIFEGEKDAAQSFYEQATIKGEPAWSGYETPMPTISIAEEKRRRMRLASDESPIEALQMICDAFKELKIYGVDELICKIRAALSSPAVPEIKGLEEATKLFGEYKETSAMHLILKAARTYAALPKLQKVVLDGAKFISPDHAQNPDFASGYNAALDDIKAKYGDLYADVK